MNSTQITIETSIHAEPEKVWECWTKPSHITQWNFATEDWCCPNAENDLRVGGIYRARMEAKNGSFGFDFEATYDEISEHKKIAYTMSDDRKVITEFSASDDVTKVTTIFDAESENPIEMQRDGWQAILNNFKQYVETQ